MKRWQRMLVSVYGGLVLQSRLKGYLDAVGLSIDESGVSADFSALESGLDARYGSDRSNAVIDRIELVRFAGEGLSGMGWQGETVLDRWIGLAEAANDATWTVSAAA